MNSEALVRMQCAVCGTESDCRVVFEKKRGVRIEPLAALWCITAKQSDLLYFVVEFRCPQHPPEKKGLHFPCLSG